MDAEFYYTKKASAIFQKRNGGGINKEASL